MTTLPTGPIFQSDTFWVQSIYQNPTYGTKATVFGGLLSIQCPIGPMRCVHSARSYVSTLWGVLSDRDPPSFRGRRQMAPIPCEHKLLFLKIRGCKTHEILLASGNSQQYISVEASWMTCSKVCSWHIAKGALWITRVLGARQTIYGEPRQTFWNRSCARFIW